jgi:microcystin-dependent protein
MGTPFMGEIKIISWNFAPQGWAFCNGQFLPINQNQALFSILGTTYGGNGQTTFALPDLRGRAPLHRGSQNTLGTKAGQEAHTLTQSEMPAHTHIAQASTQIGTVLTASGNVLGKRTAEPYHAPTTLGIMQPDTISNVGQSQPHNNMQPYLVLNYIIALQGIFPSHN